MAQLGDEVVHGHRALHREPEVERVPLHAVTIGHADSNPDSSESNFLSTPPVIYNSDISSLKSVVPRAIGKYNIAGYTYLK